MYYHKINSPFGKLLITADDKGLTALNFESGELTLTLANNARHSSHHFVQTEQQLAEYFAHQRTAFNLPLSFHGTDFQQLVWQQLTTIPFGTTQSYTWLAQQIKRPKAVRAVGAANGKNRIALIVPCHRVIGSNGKLTGYAGGLSLKAQLLAHEQVQLSR